MKQETRASPHFKVSTRPFGQGQKSRHGWCVVPTLTAGARYADVMHYTILVPLYTANTEGSDYHSVSLYFRNECICRCVVTFTRCRSAHHCYLHWATRHHQMNTPRLHAPLSTGAKAGIVTCLLSLFSCYLRLHSTPLPTVHTFLNVMLQRNWKYIFEGCNGLKASPRKERTSIVAPCCKTWCHHATWFLRQSCCDPSQQSRTNPRRFQELPRGEVFNAATAHKIKKLILLPMFTPIFFF